ncbi:radical SAM protein [bacterium]|nr:radical SAM protein [bacterium]
MQEKTVRVCHFHKLKIKQNGDIYPCCRSRKYTKLGNIFDEDIYKKIENTDVICECNMFKSVARTPEDKINLNYIHYETSNLCQANCVCCPQSKEPLNNEKELLQKINEMIERYRPKHIIAIGGEILVQEEAFNMLFDLHQKYPEMEIQTITNLCVGEERLKKAEEIFDAMTVSMLGFNKHTYKNEMGLDFDKVINNFETLYANKKVQLSPKFLAMPTNLFEISEFFNWAVKKDVQKIYLHCIHEFKKVANVENIYWQKTFAKVEKEIKQILKDNREFIISRNRHFISIDEMLAGFINIDNDYISENGFEKYIYLTT